MTPLRVHLWPMDNATMHATLKQQSQTTNVVLNIRLHTKENRQTWSWMLFECAAKHSSTLSPHWSICAVTGTQVHASLPVLVAEVTKTAKNCINKELLGHKAEVKAAPCQTISTRSNLASRSQLQRGLTRGNSVQQPWRNLGIQGS